MAAVTTDKALNLCSRLMAAADQLMTAVERLAALKDEKESSGLDLNAAAVLTALAASTVLRHAADADDFNNILSSGSALKTWLQDNFHDDIFQNVRP